MRTLDNETAHSPYRPLVIAGVGVLALAVAIGLNYHRVFEETPPSTAATDPAMQAAGPENPTAVGAPTSPSFDIARIDADGDTVLAGRATPGAIVIIKSNGTKIGEATADHRGEWVFVPEAPLAPGAHRLTVEVATANGNPLISDGEVLIIVPEKGKDITGAPASDTTRPMAILIPSAKQSASTVLQTSNAERTANSVAIETIDIDSDGGLVASGHSVTPGSTVRMLIDDRPVGQTTADAAGRWVLALPPSAVPLTTDHTLRVEEIDRNGRVIGHFDSRLRLLPANAAAVQQPQGTVVVQRGDNLWRIARHFYGQGMAYTIIFRANRNRITNPDVIYPGQTFQMPSSAD